MSERSMENIRNIVLVHGAFVDGSGHCVFISQPEAVARVIVAAAGAAHPAVA